MCQNQNLFKLFQYIVIQSTTIIKKYLKYCLLLYGQAINISPHSLTMINTTNTEFSFIEIWFTDKNNKQIEIEYNVNMTLMNLNIINEIFNITKIQEIC